MHDGSINLVIDRVTVGKVPVPRWLVLSFINKYTPEVSEVLDDGSIDVGNKILMFNIKNIEVEKNKIRLEIITEPSESEEDESEAENIPGPTINSTPASTPASSPTPTSLPTPTSSQPKTDPRVTALKKTNSQLKGVLSDVESTAAKEWVQLVISVNSKMINNPGGDFSSEISSAKNIYSKLPDSDRKNIKEAALNNLDIASVRFLYNEYGL
jgi:hypothetical protein